MTLLSRNPLVRVMAGLDPAIQAQSLTPLVAHCFYTHFETERRQRPILTALRLDGRVKPDQDSAKYTAQPANGGNNGKRDKSDKYLPEKQDSC